MASNPFYSPEELASIGKELSAQGIDPNPTPTPMDSLKTSNLEAKLQAVTDARNAKITELDRMRGVLASGTKAYEERQALADKSLVGRLGLDPDGITGSVVNAAAGLVAGGSRQLVGASLALPYTASTMAVEGSLSQMDTEAYNRYVQGQATPEDMLRLNSHRNTDGAVTGFAAAKASMSANSGPTVLELFQQANATRKVARGINDTFNIDSIEHQGEKNKLDDALSDGFKENAEKIKGGDVASGIAGLLTNVGSAAFAHPRGVFQYVAENAPQLLVGGLGTAGKVAMTASNVGYAADYYQQGIENFQKDNKGQFPAADERAKIAAWAASLALAEEAGDRIGLGAMKLAGKAEGEAAKVGMVQSLKNTLKAAAEGTVGETLTEGYQGYAEDVTAGKRAWNDLSQDALENIYKNAAIGGLTGGALAGGVHGIAEATQSTPEQAEVRAKKATKDALFAQAAQTGNVDAFMDKAAPTYDPVSAMGALAQHNLGETATTESRMQNFDKAVEIVRELDAKRVELAETIKTGTPEEKKAAQAELADVLKQSNEGNPIIQKMMDEMTKNTVNVPIQEQIKQVDTPIASADEETKVQAAAATENVINLSMASTRHLTPEQATSLANNTENGLDKGQRKFLRVFSAARQAFNAAQKLGSVTDAILNGDKKTGDLGLTQYRDRIGASLAKADKVSAVKDLGMLTKFATSQAEKAAVAQEGVEKYGNNVQVYKTENGWGYAAPGTYDEQELSDGGGLKFVTPRLLEAMQKEAKAIALTRDEMTHAVSMKFGRAAPTQTASAPVQSSVPTPAPTAKQPENPAPASASEKETASPGDKSIDLFVEGSARLNEESVQTSPLSAPNVSEKQQVNEKNSSSAVTSPSSEPSVPVLAGARTDTVPSSAAVTGKQAQDNLAELANPPSSHTTDRARDMLAWAQEQSAKIKEQLDNYGEVDEGHAELEDAHALVKVLAKEAAKSIEADEILAKNTEDQPEAAEQQAAVSEANPAPVAEAATAAIEALNETTPEGTPYNQRKLGDFFSVTGLGSNPLVSVKNFMSSIKSVDALTEFLGEEPNVDEKRGLRTFMRVFKGWSENVKQNLKQHDKAEYNYEDAMQYFIRPDGDIEENVKTAIVYAAYSYVVENFGKRRNTDAEINRMLGRDKNDNIGPMEEKLRYMTAFQSSAVNALGQRIVQALGLKAKEGTPVNELPRMQAALGAHALRLLIDGKDSLMVRYEVTASQLEAMKAKNTEADATIEPGIPEGMQAGDKIMLLQVRRNADGTLPDRSRFIVEGNKDSKSVVNRLFGVEDPIKPPTFKPVSMTKKFTKRTQQLVPEFLKDILKSLNRQPNFLRQDKLAILDALGDDRFLSMMGAESLDGRTAANIDKISARNEGLERELFNLKDFIKNYLMSSENGLDTAFFFEHYAMRQQRVGIANNLVNPQLSKIHRFFMYRNSWKAKVAIGNDEQMDNFWLRVAEGFGVKTETMEKYDAINKMIATYQSEPVQAAIAAIQKITAGEALSDAEKDAIVAAVGKAGEDAHSLDALVGLASYHAAEEAGEATFEANMMGEVDGVTNGPMLSMLLMGAAGSVQDLFSTLNLGGFFQTGSHTEFNSFRKDNQDLYLKTAGNLLNVLDDLVKDGEISKAELDAVNYFVGNLRDETTQNVTKDGRNFVKTPITGIVYGSSIATAVKNMAGDFFDKINKKIEGLHARQAKGEDMVADLNKLIKNLRAVGLNVEEGTSVSDLMTKEFSQAELGILSSTFKETYGKAVKESFKKDFAHLLENRKQFNEVASIAFDVYDAAYVSVRNQLMEELVANGEIPATTYGSPLHDFTPAQEATFQERMAKITPTLATAMSNMSGPSAANTGMLVAKSKVEVDTTKPYKSQVKFGTSIKDVVNSKGEHPTSMLAYGRKTVNTNPGVALGATSTHSFDAAVAMSALWNNLRNKAYEVLNLHDAGGTGIEGLKEQGLRMNQAVWDRALEYSPAQEMYNTYMRSMRGVQELLASENVPAGFKRELANRLVAQSQATERKQPDGSVKKIAAQSLLMVRALQAKQLAFTIDSLKFDAMSQMGAVAQYAIEGGALQVTDKMRDAAVAKLQGMQAAMPVEDVQTVRAVGDAIKKVLAVAVTEADAKRAEKGPSVAPKANPKLFGTVGKSSNNDTALLGFFARNPNPTMGQLAEVLGKQNLTPFQSRLLASLKRSLGDRQAAFTVKFVTKATLANEVLERPKRPSHAWFVSKNGQNTMYVLSGDFKESAVQAETLLHELTHAAVAHAIANPDETTRPIVEELETLRQQLLAQNVAGFEHMLSDVQELVAYGMTNAPFQKFLDSQLFQTKTGSNQWITGLKKFIDSLVKLVFPARQNAQMSTGMTALIANVSGLMAASSVNDYSTTKTINQSMAAPLDNLSSVQMYDALGQLGTGPVDPAFADHLRNVLDLMEQSVHSPLSALKAVAQQTAVQTPHQLWVMAKRKGAATFGRGAMASGFKFTEQEAFAMQQVQATIATALSNEDGSTTGLYRELSRLYREAYKNLSGRISEFHPDSKQAKALFDFIFKMEADNGDRSDYLSRFAALGITNQQFNKLLAFNTEVRSESMAHMSFSEKLHEVFERILNWVSARATKTFDGQKGDDKLTSLVEQLVDIEQRKRMKLAQSVGNVVDTFESVFRGAATTGINSAAAIANSPFFRNSTNGVTRLAGRVASITVQGRMDHYLDTVQTFRDKFIGGRNGILMGTLNEMRGAFEGNAVMHKLIRISKRIEGVRKDMITNTAGFVRNSFNDEGKYLTKEMNNAISAVLLRTDVASLMQHFDMQAITRILKSPAELNRQIAAFEGQLGQFGPLASFYRNGADNLGIFMATGKPGAENLRLNAENIANMLGFKQANKVDSVVVEKATPIIDALATLYALKHISSHPATSHHMQHLGKVIDTEAARTDDGNGVELVLKMHQHLQDESKERLFQGAGVHRMKGYTPEIYNPYIRIEVAGSADGKLLQERGFDRGAGVPEAEADPKKTNDKNIYVMRDGGMVQYLTGVFSYTGMGRRGSSLHSGNLDVNSDAGKFNANKMRKIALKQKANLELQGKQAINMQAASEKEAFLVPVFDVNGNLVNHRYMMNVQTKDDVLERNNDFSNMLGVMAGNIFDKEKTAEQNRVAVQALYDQYKQDFNAHPQSYVAVGPQSTDPEAREVWNLLPQETKAAVAQIWGSNGMMVRNDQLDISFGYRKLSMAEPFNMKPDERSKWQEIYVNFFEHLLGKKAGLRVRQFEDIWQALVREAKDTMVVKSGITLMGNFTSNLSELVWFGVPITDIWHHHRVALKGITSYRKDSKRLDALERALKLNHLQGQNRGEVEREIVRLKDALAHNPVRELIDAGLMPTIVEDVAQDEDQYSYKSMLTEKVNGVIEKINPHVLKAVKVAVMAHDTDLYKVLSYGTQVSDFVARYTLYKHVVGRAKNPIDAQTAIQLVTDAFVSYDIPSHRSMQYANDMGLVYFSKYYLRIQKVIALLYKQNPGRALMLLTAGHFLDFLPMLQHSAALHRIGNPLSLGAFEAVSSLDELLTVNALLTPFR